MLPDSASLMFELHVHYPMAEVGNAFYPIDGICHNPFHETSG